MTADQEEPPITGDEALDQALQQVAGLESHPLADHPAVLREAQEALQHFLQSSSTT